MACGNAGLNEETLQSHAEIMFMRKFLTMAALFACCGIAQAQSIGTTGISGVNGPGAASGRSGGSIGSAGSGNYGNGSAAGAGNLLLQVPSSVFETAASNDSRQDPQSYCYFNDKRYSEGSKLNDRICARPGADASGGMVLSSAPPALKWISAAQYARGKY